MTMMNLLLRCQRKPFYDVVSKNRQGLSQIPLHQESCRTAVLDLTGCMVWQAEISFNYTSLSFAEMISASTMMRSSSSAVDLQSELLSMVFCRKLLSPTLFPPGVLLPRRYDPHEGQICNCFTVPLSVDNSASLSQLFKIVGEVNLQIFLNKINVWFDTVTPEKSCH